MGSNFLPIWYNWCFIPFNYGTCRMSCRDHCIMCFDSSLQSRYCWLEGLNITLLFCWSSHYGTIHNYTNIFFLSFGHKALVSSTSIHFVLGVEARYYKDQKKLIKSSKNSLYCLLITNFYLATICSRVELSLKWSPFMVALRDILHHISKLLPFEDKWRTQVQG